MVNTVYKNRFSGARGKSDHFFYYIPLFETLKNLLQHKDIQSELTLLKISVMVQYLETTPYFLVTQKALQIIAYFED